MQKSRARSISDFNHRVRETTSFLVIDYVFDDKLPLETASESSAGTLASGIYNKHQRKTFLPYRILEVQTSTVAMKEYGIANTASVAHTAHAPALQPKCRCDGTLRETRQSTNLKTHSTKLANATPHEASSTHEYVVV